MDICKQDDRALPDIPVKAGFAQLLARNSIRIPQQAKALPGDLADDPDSKPRPGERLPPDHLLRQPQLSANSTHLILEQGAQRLNKLKTKVFRQAAHIVVALDISRTVAASGLHNIGVQRPLNKELHFPAFAAGLRNNITRSLLKSTDKFLADDLTLTFRLAHPFKRVKEILGSIYSNQFYPCRLNEVMPDLFNLTFAEETVIYEHACQPVADSFMHKRSSNSRIHPAGKPADHLLIANLFPYLRNLLIDNAGRVPAAWEPRFLMQEILKKVLPQGGMLHFGMPLHTIQFPRLIFHSGYRGAFGMGQHRKPLRSLTHCHTMAHPCGLPRRGT